MCFDYVFEKGYKHPVYIGCGSEADNERRIEGINDSIARNAPGMNVPLYIAESPFKCGYYDTRTALEEHPETDVIVYSADCFAVAGMCMLQELGIKVPEQLGFIAAEESVYSTVSHPYMTSLDSKVEYACQEACDIILNIFSGENNRKTVMLEPGINERETTREMN